MGRRRVGVDDNQEIDVKMLVLGKGRPKGSVKKPKQPKQTKAKVKAAAKKSKEPKNNKTASNWLSLVQLLYLMNKDFVSS